MRLKQHPRKNKLAIRYEYLKVSERLTSISDSKMSVWFRQKPYKGWLKMTVNWRCYSPRRTSVRVDQLIRAGEIYLKWEIGLKQGQNQPKRRFWAENWRKLNHRTSISDGLGRHIGSAGPLIDRNFLANDAVDPRCSNKQWMFRQQPESCRGCAATYRRG